MKLSEKIERKFIESLDVDDWMILTDTGWEDISSSNKTIEYEIWELETENGIRLESADNHIVFNSYYQEVFIKDMKPGDIIITQHGGVDIVKSVRNTYIKESMYDLSVDSENHRYYTNGILSHNTTVVAGILLHYAMFNYDKKTIGIIANKMAQAREIMDRIREMYEQLPFFLQVGVRGYNKSQITFSNNASIFCASSANGGLRGRSVDVLYLDEAAFLANDLEFYESTYPIISSSDTTKIIMTSTPNGRRGLFFNIYDNAHEDIKQSKNGYVRVLATWKSDPRKDENWKNKTIEEFGIARFEQEFNCVTGDTMITIRNKETGVIQNISIEDLCKLL